MQIREETEKGLLVLKKLLPAGISVLAQVRPWPNRYASLLTIGNGDRKTDVVVPDSFLDDLPASQQRQALTRLYGVAVGGRTRCGSPNIFFCKSGVVAEICVQWPIQSTGVQSFMLGQVLRKSDGQVRNCSLELQGLGFGQTVFDYLATFINCVRDAIDFNEISFNEPGAEGNGFPRLRPIPRREASPREQEQFLSKKVYQMGFLLADDRDCETWANDPWDAAYLGISQKDLQMASRQLLARGLLELDVSFEYARPTTRLLEMESQQPVQKVPPSKVTRHQLPLKEILLRDVTSILDVRSEVAVLVIDLDNFKHLNDTEGHSAGDECLDRIVNDIGTILGGRGELYRWGQGDEFVVLLPAVIAEEARVTAERIRRAIAENEPERSIPVTASIGICATEQAGFDSAEGILNRADKAMYKSKRSGKNQVTVWNADLQAESNI